MSSPLPSTCHGTGTTAAANRWPEDNVVRSSENICFEPALHTLTSPSLLDGHGDQEWDLETPPYLPWYFHEEQMTGKHLTNVAHREPWWSSFHAEGQLEPDACAQPGRISKKLDASISTDHLRKQSYLRMNDNQDVVAGVFEDTRLSDTIMRGKDNVTDPKPQQTTAHCMSGQELSETLWPTQCCIPLCSNRSELRGSEKMSDRASRGNDASNPKSRCGDEHNRLREAGRKCGSSLGVIKDRHSKVYTSQGLRDRRVRLSLATAIQVYDIQDRLGYDRASQAIDWLLSTAKAAIDKLPKHLSSGPDCRSSLASGTPKECQISGTPESTYSGVQARRGYSVRHGYKNQSNQVTNKRIPSSSKTSKSGGGVGTVAIKARRWGSRANARKRARDRTMQKRRESVNFGTTFTLLVCLFDSELAYVGKNSPNRKPKTSRLCQVEELRLMQLSFHENRFLTGFQNASSSGIRELTAAFNLAKSL